MQERHVLLRESARLRQYVLFYLQFLKVSTLRFLKNSVGKVYDLRISLAIVFELSLIGCAILVDFTYSLFHVFYFWLLRIAKIKTCVFNAP